MKDFFAQLYNAFLLRDLLGYVIPGSFVLACLLHIVSLSLDADYLIIIRELPNSFFAIFLIFGLSYACGHFLSGLFFHSGLFHWAFKYIPDDLDARAEKKNNIDTWSIHRARYKEASERSGLLMQGHIERHAALVHFTGHFSAGLVFIIIYISAISIYLKSIYVLTFSIPAVILLPGIYSHYKQLLKERYLLEKSVITNFEESKKLPN